MVLVTELYIRVIFKQKAAFCEIVEPIRLENKAWLKKMLELSCKMFAY